MGEEIQERLFPSLDPLCLEVINPFIVVEQDLVEGEPPPDPPVESEGGKSDQKVEEDPFTHGQRRVVPE
jgi:hypothetical protein